MSKIFFDRESESYFFNCPHCGDMIQVLKSEIRCKIFRHGVYKENLKQVPPHSKKSLCDKLREENLVYGCCKPFKFDGEKVEICGYI